MAFARALKQLGVKVSLSQVLDASRAVEHVDLAEKTDFRALLRANMVSQKEDFPAFDLLFDCFWREMSYERVPMETMEIEGTPSESPAPEGGDEEGGLEEATAETLAKENLPLENLDEFSVPTYSPQELMNRKDFSEMGRGGEPRCRARDSPDRDQDRNANQPAQKNRPQGQYGRSTLDDAPQHEIRRRARRVGASQAPHQKNQSRAALRRERLDGLLQSILDSIHVWPAKRIVGRGDFRFPAPRSAGFTHLIRT